MTENVLKRNKFWQQFQEFIGNSIHDLMIRILISSGYDCALSISEIDDTDIQLIENHIKSNPYLLKGCKAYSEIIGENNTFTLLPGHKKLLYTLNKKAKEFIIERKKSNTRQSDNTQSDNTVEEVELLLESEIEQLKEKLVKKLNSSLKIFDLSGEFTNKEIGGLDAYLSKNSRRSNNKPAYKCSVQCALCTSTIPCTHISHWQTSNIDRHLKKHSKEKSNNTKSPKKSSEKNNNNSPSTSNLTSNASSNVQNELDNVLGIS